ncbi:MULTISPECIES: PaaI family thioesterase [Stenotrophomonas]|uniref:Acyl-coenzyme A thioesterase THEM4 n=1 Tax=Stenotrophomonas lactitubi TaxID=2045214 RepID=A0AAW4GK36_9GAMM|nr:MULTISPECIES: PaaI family thioesterase [unclassified Stenotrophomonas]MBM9914545.1 PaaI family thioesterase [Stenotrophomonas lactitubi]MBM9922834.1 PaaI family thioesterase [Stenotrophomonas lactitubi]MBM9938674.1 PaaI family thioesterase [Stenotrophomonas lactitubi]
MSLLSIQDRYPEAFSHCFGCGKSNPHGHRLKSWYVNKQVQATFTIPKIYCGGVPGFAYGGIVASLLDCHGTAAAAAFHCADEGTVLDDRPIATRYVTASLSVEFLQPTPLEVELSLVGKLHHSEGRKVFVDLEMGRDGTTFATARMLAIRLKNELDE